MLHDAPAMNRTLVSKVNNLNKTSLREHLTAEKLVMSIRFYISEDDSLSRPFLLMFVTEKCQNRFLSLVHYKNKLILSYYVKSLK